MFGSDGVVRATAGRFEGDRAAVRTSAVSCAGVRAPPAPGFVCLARSEMDVSARVTNLIRPPYFSSSICG
jgi:hypothetical protein